MFTEFNGTARQQLNYNDARNMKCQTVYKEGHDDKF